MVKVSLVLCLIAVWAITEVSSTTHSHAHAPAPSVDCFNLILTMSDCLTYVSNESKLTKPEGGCCSGLKKVLKVKAECICEAFKNSAQYGVTLNITKAATLPSVCGVKAPPISKCDLSGSPSPAPAYAPKSPGSTPGMAPSGPGGSSGITGPSPAKSGASALSIPFVALVSVVVASCYFF